MKSRGFLVCLLVLSASPACGRKPLKTASRKAEQRPVFPPPVKAEVAPELATRLRAMILGHTVPRPFEKAQKAEVAELIGQLGSPQFTVRESASRKLMAYGKHALPDLDAARKHKDLEIADRAESISRSIRSGQPEERLAAELLKTQMQSLAVIDAVHTERETSLGSSSASGLGRDEIEALRQTCAALKRLRGKVDRPDYLEMARELYAVGRFDETEEMLKTYIAAPGRDPEMKKKAGVAMQLVKTEKQNEARRKKKADAAGKPYPRRSRMMSAWGYRDSRSMVRVMQFDMVLGRLGTRGGMIRMFGGRPRP